MQRELRNPFGCDADQRFDTKVKCPTARAHFRSNSPLLGVKLQSNAGGMPGAEGGMGGFRIDWYIFSQLLSRVIFCYANTENVFNRLKHLGEL